MYDDIKAYFMENVLASYNQYFAEKRKARTGVSRDLRLGINCATMLYHLREHIPSSMVLRKWQHLVKLCPDYELLGDVVNASKHGTLHEGRKSRRAPKVLKAKDIREVLVCTEYYDDQGTYRHWKKAIFVKLADGSERDLSEVLTNVMNMWIFELSRAGLISYSRLFSYGKPSTPARQECSDRMAFDMLQGVRFKQVIIFQKYNYCKQRVEPMDISDQKFSFRIFEPSKSLLSVVAVEKTTGKRMKTKIEIPVTEEELRAFQELRTKEEQLQYYGLMGLQKGLLEIDPATNTVVIQMEEIV